jgi:hypothetical protein
MTYQVAGQLPAISVREGDHVVSYYKSQPRSQVHARTLRLRTFVEESHCALQFSHGVGTGPRHVQIVEHDGCGQLYAHRGCAKASGRDV